MQVVFAKSVQGESHKRREQEIENLKNNRTFPCQDKSLAGEFTSGDGIKFTFLCACDGHGGASYFRSDKGADFAIQVLQDILIRNMKRINELAVNGEFKKIKEQLSLAITKRWKEKVINDISENPITDIEYQYLGKEKPETVEKYKQGIGVTSIYGCTMIAYFATETYWYALQIGDGDLAISYDGKVFEMPMPEDEECFLNQTTSLCDDNAVNEFRWISNTTIPQFVFCSTDGIANSFKDNTTLISNFYLPVSQLFNEEDQYEKCHQCKNNICDIKCRFELCKVEIENYLPLLSKKGSGDDITLVLAVQIDDAKIQSILNYLRGTKLYKNGQKDKGITLLKQASLLGNNKALERLGDKCVDAIIKVNESQRKKLVLSALRYYTDAYENSKDPSILLKIDNLKRDYQTELLENV